MLELPTITIIGIKSKVKSKYGNIFEKRIIDIPVQIILNKNSFQFLYARATYNNNNSYRESKVKNTYGNIFEKRIIDIPVQVILIKNSFQFLGKFN